MRNSKHLDERLFGIAFADIMISFAAFLFMLFVMIAIQTHKDSDDSKMLGSVCAELYWDNNRNVDLDLWGKSPLDEHGIGYSNMHGHGLDLYRDVVGFYNNPEKINMEVMCAHQPYHGEWVFNVHYFSDHEVTNPPDPNHKSIIQAVMIIRIKYPDKSVKIMRGTFDVVEGEEKTMFDFVIDANGRLDERSINSRNIYIRSK